MSLYLFKNNHLPTIPTITTNYTIFFTLLGTFQWRCTNTMSAYMWVYLIWLAVKNNFHFGFLSFVNLKNNVQASTAICSTVTTYTYHQSVIKSPFRFGLAGSKVTQNKQTDKKIIIVLSL